MLCPCQSSQPYADCCQPFHTGQRQPENAEQLMRSRYAAYALQQIDYLVRTTVPAQQPLLDVNSIAQWSREAQWLGLTVHQHIPRIGKRHAQVAFTARFAEHGSAHEHNELSTFVQINGAWYFICRNQQRCLHFSDFGCRQIWQVLQVVKNAERHGEAAWFLIICESC